MGNVLWCFNSDELGYDDPWLKEVFSKTSVERQENEFSQAEDQRSVLKSSMVQRILSADKPSWSDLQKDNNQMPKYKDFSSEPEYVSEPDELSREGDTGHSGIGQICSELDGITDWTISPHEPFVSNDEEDIKEEISNTMNDSEENKQRSDSSCQINLQVQTLNVTGAGDSAVNGVYRWFTAHGRFVMFTDKGHYQIVGGVNLSKQYGDRYNDCWVVEENTQSVVRLYAVALDLSTSIPRDGWICMNGFSPAPNVQEGDEKEVFEEGLTESEDCDASLSLMPTGYFTKPSASSNLEGLDVEWVV